MEVGERVCRREGRGGGKKEIIHLLLPNSGQPLNSEQRTLTAAQSDLSSTK